VAIASQPAAARVVREADGTVVGVTPLVETWSRGEGVEKLRLEKDGYLPQPVAVSLRANAELAIVLKKDVPPAARKKRPGVTAPTSPPAPRPERASPLAEPEPDPI
jgi:hypothetical protein